MPPAPAGATLEEVIAQLTASTAVLPALVHVFDLRTQRSIYANRTLATALGHPADAPYDTLLHPQDHARLGAMFGRWAHAADGAILQTTYRARDAQGRWRRLLSQDRLLARTRAGAPALVVGTLTDITPLETRYQYAASTERLEALGRLAGGVAHDFNNYLTGILGCGQVLVEDPPADEVRRLSAEILRSAERAVELARLLLGFGRTRTDRAQEGTSDARPAVRDTATILRRLIPDGVQVDVRAPEETFAVELGPGQVGRITGYLLLDAVDAVGDEGTIRLELEGVELAAPQDGLRAGRWVRIVVEDDGGARELDIDVEPFELAEGAFGLAAVRALVDPRGGRVRAVSAEAGARVEVWLPRRETPEAPAAAVEGRTALVVDDEPSVQRLLAKVLRRAGYDVFAVGDGESALELGQLQEAPFDLAICDYELPDLMGLEVFDRLEGRIRLQVLTTGRQPDAKLDRELKRRGLRLLVKPFSPSDLLRFLDDAMG